VASSNLWDCSGRSPSHNIENLTKEGRGAHAENERRDLEKKARNQQYSVCCNRSSIHGGAFWGKTKSGAGERQNFLKKGEENQGESKLPTKYRKTWGMVLGRKTKKKINLEDLTRIRKWSQVQEGEKAAGADGNSETKKLLKATGRRYNSSDETDGFRRIRVLHRDGNGKKLARRRGTVPYSGNIPQPTEEQIQEGGETTRLGQREFHAGRFDGKPCLSVLKRPTGTRLDGYDTSSEGAESTIIK